MAESQNAVERAHVGLPLRRIIVIVVHLHQPATMDIS